MAGKASARESWARRSSAAERSAVRAAALRKGRHGKREQSDCGAELHEAILRPIGTRFAGFVHWG